MSSLERVPDSGGLRLERFHRITKTKSYRESIG